jgi:hypothetical protein
MSRKQYVHRPVKAPKTGGARLCCRECGGALSAPKTIARGMCRSCWRVYQLVAT